jgi:hypothetical protein
MKGTIQHIRTQLTPPRWDSWQTLLLLSVFSAVLGGLATSPVKDVIATFGWVWLILGVWWLVYDQKKVLTFSGWFVGPWIVSALTMGFLASTFPSQIALSAVIILWAPVSAAIAILPSFIQSNKETKEPEWAKPRKDKRPGLALLLLSHLMVACWFQFYFLLQSWLAAYPSLQAESFEHSAFVTKVQPGRTSRGDLVLKVAEESLKAQLSQKDWPDVEKWLLDLNRNLPALQQDVQVRLGKQILRLPEDSLWGISGRVTGGEYDLELQADWQGPRSDNNGHQVTKLCRITPTTKATLPQNLKFKPGEITKSLPKFRTVAKIQCEAPTDPTPSKPDENGTTGITG